MKNIHLACKTLPKRTQPRIVAFTGESDTQNLLVCEEKILCKITLFTYATLINIVLYYIYVCI